MKNAWFKRITHLVVITYFLVAVVVAPLNASNIRRSFSECSEIIKTLKFRARQRTITPFVQAFFPPHDNVQPLLCGLIEEETEGIDVEAFQLTNRQIAQSLLEAHYRGVDVRLIVDVGALGRFSKVLQLYNEGIPVFIYPQDGVSAGYSLMHNKIMLLRSLQCIVTGSMNFTNAGVDKNRENVVIIQDRQLFEEYAHQFRALMKETTQLRGER